LVPLFGRPSSTVAASCLPSSCQLFFLGELLSIVMLTIIINVSIIIWGRSFLSIITQGSIIPPNSPNTLLGIHWKSSRSGESDARQQGGHDLPFTHRNTNCFDVFDPAELGYVRFRQHTRSIYTRLFFRIAEGECLKKDCLGVKKHADKSYE
jgi:hypothetical protein